MNYLILKSQSIEEAMQASTKSTGLSSELKGTEGIAWAQTVAVCMDKVDHKGFSLDTSKENIQLIGKKLKEVMQATILSSVTIPENGKDRDGKDMKVCGKDGVPKWSTWEATRRIWAYLGDIAKVIAYGKAEDLYPESLKVAARCDILADCKAGETPVEAVERLCKQLQPNLDKMATNAEVLKARSLRNALTVNNLEPIDEASDCIDRLDAILSACDSDQLDTVRSMLKKLTPYFV